MMGNAITTTTTATTITKKIQIFQARLIQKTKSRVPLYSLQGPSCPLFSALSLTPCVMMPQQSWYSCHAANTSSSSLSHTFAHDDPPNPKVVPWITLSYSHCSSQTSSQEAFLGLIILCRGPSSHQLLVALYPEP